MTTERISHDRNDETIQAKTRWFRSIPLAERMELLCAFTDLALELRPELARRDAQPTQRRIQVLAEK